MAVRPTLRYAATKRNLARKLFYDPWGSLRAVWWCLIGALVIASLLAAIITVVIVGERAVGRTSCKKWGEQTGYPTKFKILNFFDGGTCLAKTQSGKWIVNSNVIFFANKQRP